MIKRVTALLMLVPLCAAAGQADGVWKTESSATGEYLEVRLGPCGYDLSKTCGLIVGTVGMPEDLAGMPVIADMAPAGPGRWSDGQFWVAGEDRVYHSRMVVDGDRLLVEGCIAVFCVGQVWTRMR